MRISDWSSDVCSSVLQQAAELLQGFAQRQQRFGQQARRRDEPLDRRVRRSLQAVALLLPAGAGIDQIGRATSELQSLMRISYAVFCLKKKINKNKQNRCNKYRVENRQNKNERRSQYVSSHTRT